MDASLSLLDFCSLGNCFDLRLSLVLFSCFLAPMSVSLSICVFLTLFFVYFLIFIEHILQGDLVCLTMSLAYSCI